MSYPSYKNTNYPGNDISNEPFGAESARVKCSSMDNCVGYSISTYTPWKCNNIGSNIIASRINSIGTSECLTPNGDPGTCWRKDNNDCQATINNAQNNKIYSEKYNSSVPWHLGTFNGANLKSINDATTVYYKSATGNPVNDIYSSYYSKLNKLPKMDYSSYPNTDYFTDKNPDVDIIVSSNKDCQKTCNELAGCIGFTVADGNCYFKNNKVSVPAYSDKGTFYYKNFSNIPAPLPAHNGNWVCSSLNTRMDVFNDNGKPGFYPRNQWTEKEYTNGCNDWVTEDRNSGNSVPGTKGCRTTGAITGKGKCIDIAGFAKNNRARVQLYDCNGAGNQQFKYLADTHQLVSQDSGKCLDLASGNEGNLTNIQLYDCDPNNMNQKWLIGNQRIHLQKNQNKCMDIDGSNNNIVLYDCNSHESQRITFNANVFGGCVAQPNNDTSTSKFMLRNLKDNNCADSGGNPEGKGMYLSSSCNSGNNYQTWNMTVTNQIKSKQTRSPNILDIKEMCLGSNGAVEECNNDNTNQRWIKPMDRTLRNMSDTNKCLNQDFKLTNCDGSLSQQWKFENIENSIAAVNATVSNATNAIAAVLGGW